MLLSTLPSTPSEMNRNINHSKMQKKKKKKKTLVSSFVFLGVLLFLLTSARLFFFLKKKQEKETKTNSNPTLVCKQPSLTPSTAHLQN
mmetsp:Transcript_12478/g.25405  ORF Transcript_12478/g.25405 Transcript_12478/m.25405 type:complete len:88 (-) Transcript_12478:42-305(-)